MIDRRRQYITIALLVALAAVCEIARCHGADSPPATRAVVERPVGKATLTIYWAKWCPPCHALAADLQADPDFDAALREKYCWRWVDCDPTGVGTLLFGMQQLPTFVTSDGIKFVGYGDRGGISRKDDFRSRLGLRPARAAQATAAVPPPPEPPPLKAPPSNAVTREQHDADLDGVRTLIDTNTQALQENIRRTDEAAKTNDAAIVAKLQEFHKAIHGLPTKEDLAKQSETLTTEQQAIRNESASGFKSLGEKIGGIVKVVQGLTGKTPDPATPEDEPTTKLGEAAQKIQRITGVVSMVAKVAGFALAPEIAIPLDILSSAGIGGSLVAWFRRRRRGDAPQPPPAVATPAAPPPPAPLPPDTDALHAQLAATTELLRQLQGEMAAIKATGRPNPQIAILEQKIADLHAQQERTRLEFVRLNVPDAAGEAYREAIKRVSSLYPTHSTLFAQIEGAAQQLLDGKKAADRGVAVEVKPGWKTD